MGIENDEQEFDNFMDDYDLKQQEVLEEREKLFKEYEHIQDLEGRNEYITIDMNRYKMYYFGWSIGTIMILLLSTKLFKK
jgi:hypothetical protein